MEQSNEKKQTALQQAISQIDKDISNYEHNDDGLLALKNMRITLTTLLEVEREQICDAYDIGSYSGLSGGAGTSEYYFTQTFKSE